MESPISEMVIREPRQERSRETMDRVMVALESLLNEKPFERITMIELAQRSGTGTSSIYARFKDKGSLVLGVHARLQEHTFPCLEQMSEVGRWKGKSIESIVFPCVLTVVKFYRKHAHIVRAALMVDVPSVHERQVRVLQFASERFSTMFAIILKNADKDAIDRAVDSSVRIVSSVMHQSLIFKSMP